MRRIDWISPIMAGIFGCMAAVASPCACGAGSATGAIEKRQAAAAAPPAPSQGSVAFAGKGIIGTWVGTLEGEGKMDIDPAPGGFKVSLQVSDASGCVGFIEAIGSISGDTLTLVQNRDGQECTISIRFVGETAEVRERNCSGHHGASCGFNGTLKQVD